MSILTSLSLRWRVHTHNVTRLNRRNLALLRRFSNWSTLLATSLLQIICASGIGSSLGQHLLASLFFSSLNLSLHGELSLKKFLLLLFFSLDPLLLLFLVEACSLF